MGKKIGAVCVKLTKVPVHKGAVIMTSPAPPPPPTRATKATGANRWPHLPARFQLVPWTWGRL